MLLDGTKTLPYERQNAKTETKSSSLGGCNLNKKMEKEILKLIE